MKDPFDQWYCVDEAKDYTDEELEKLAAKIAESGSKQLSLPIIKSTETWSFSVPIKSFGPLKFTHVSPSKDPHYPHKCDACGKDAYNGATSTEHRFVADAAKCLKK